MHSKVLIMEEKAHLGFREQRRRHKVALLIFSVAAAVLVFCATSVIVAWISTSDTINETLKRTTYTFRSMQGLSARLEIATLIRPLWVIPRLNYALFDRRISLEIADRGLGLGVLQTVVQLVLWPGMQQEVHLRSIRPKNIFNPVVGQTVSLIDAPESTPELCTASWSLALLRTMDSPLVPASSNYLQNSSLPAYVVDAQLTLTDESPYRVTRQLWEWDHVNFRFGAMIRELPPLACDAHFLDRVHAVRQGSFDNFTWEGPAESPYGLGMLFGGGMPVRDLGGVFGGRITTLLSTQGAATPLLQDVLKSRYHIHEDAHALLFTQRGAVLGDTVNLDSPPVYIDEMPEGILKRGFAETKERTGETCPGAEIDFAFEGRLFHVTPFLPEAHGLPPLSERWCVLITSKRGQLYTEVDEASSSMLVFGIVSSSGLILATVLITLTLFLVLRSAARVRSKTGAMQYRKVLSAEEEFAELSHPMVLVPATLLMEMSRFEQHEALRDRGGVLVTLDSLADLNEFKRNTTICFVSHQWLSPSRPDPLGVQCFALKTALKKLFPTDDDLRTVYIWMDYFSIAQQHSRLQQLAISALPHYAASAHKFIVLAPTTIAGDDNHFDLSTYKQRGWCRAELLAKACASGAAETYMVHGDVAEIQVEHASFERISESLLVFEGTFSDDFDKERLVVPTLGLYGKLLERCHAAALFATSEPIARARSKWAALSLLQRRAVSNITELELIDTRNKLLQLIYADKERFFPKTHTIQQQRLCVARKRPYGGERELFGPLVQMMEQHVIANCAHLPLISERDKACFSQDI